LSAEQQVVDQAGGRMCVGNGHRLLFLFRIEFSDVLFSGVINKYFLCRTSMMEGSGSLEQQLEAIKVK